MMNLINFGVALALGIKFCVGLGQEKEKENFYKPLKIALHSGIGGRSHIKGALEMGHSLAGRGHNVEYASFDDCLGFSKGYNISAFSLGPQIVTPEQLRENVIGNLDGSKKQQVTLMSPEIVKIMRVSYLKTFGPLEAYLDAKKPDLLVCDFTVEACLDLAKIKGIPLIIYMQTTDIMGFVSAPYITKHMEYGPLTIENMSFRQRFISTVVEPISSIYRLLPFIKSKAELKLRYNIPQSNTVFSGLDYGLGIENTFTGLKPAVPIQPNVVQVGPILSPSLDKLDHNIDQFLNLHSKTMFIAFGSNIKLPTKDIVKFIRAGIMSLKAGTINGLIWGLGQTTIQDFSEEIIINDSVINIKDLFDGKFDGVELLKWAPQQAILNHPNTRLFVSHGGLESVMEGIYSATPILCIPYFGDQPRNAAKLVALGTGFYIDRHNTSSSSIADSINHIIKDKSDLIQVNLNRMKVITSYNSKRISLATDIIESHAYIAKACRPGLPYNPYGGLPPCETSHLITPDTRMSWIKSNLVDVYITAIVASLSIIVLVLYFLVKLVLYTYKLIKKTTVVQAKSKQT